MGIVEKVKEDYSPTLTLSTWVLLNVEKAREDACCCRELIREQEGLGPVIRLIASTSPGAPCQAPTHQAHLVKPHLVNPHLAKPSLSNPTSTCLDFFQPITTLLEIQDCWSTWPLPSGRWPRTPAAWNRSAEGGELIQGKVLQNKSFSLWQ